MYTSGDHTAAPELGGVQKSFAAEQGGKGINFSLLQVGRTFPYVQIPNAIPITLVTWNIRLHEWLIIMWAATCDYIQQG